MASMVGYPTDADEGSVANEARWRAMARLWAPSGVVDGYLNELAPTLAAGPIINVAAGAAWVDGHYAELASPASEAASANGMLVVRFTAASNLFELVYRDGVTHTGLTQTDAVYEIPIAKMASSAMTDWRGFTGGGKPNPTARFTRDTNLSIGTGVATAVAGLTSANSSYNDDPGLFQWSVTHLEVTRACLIDVTAGCSFAANGTGYRTLSITRSLVPLWRTFSSSSTVPIHLNIRTGPFEAVAGVDIEMVVFQNSGGNLNLDATEQLPFLSVQRVG